MRLGLTALSLREDLLEVSGRVTGLVALSDVRATCALLPVDRWPSVVTEALQGLALSLETAVDLHDAEHVRPLLRSRVVADGALLADDVVRRPLAPGLSEVLVVEVRGAVRHLPPAAVDGWDVSVDELFAQGRRQVLDAGLLTRSTLDLGVDVVALESTSAFAATHVCWLGTYVDPPAPGLLVALPTRHLVLVAPVLGRAQVLDAAQALLVNADALWRAGPGALSPDLWWVRGDVVVPLPGTPTSLSPPQDFVDVWEGLPG